MSVIESYSNEGQSSEVANSGTTYISYFIDCADRFYEVNIGPQVDFFGPEGYDTPPRCPIK
tara:strand:+ start:10 stop:192 length:183 start_codon:yes stop_codon:yes gene_type:complete